MQQTSNIIGWGVDAAPENRPGVPEELPPRPMGYASPGAPARQTIGVPTAKSFDRPVTPTYGTTVPLRGLSGVVRRAAYRIPAYRPSRWMLLLLADRIDVVEHNVLPMTLVVGGLAAAGFVGVRALARSR